MSLEAVPSEKYQCRERRPGSESFRLACVLTTGHPGHHRDATGGHWPREVVTQADYADLLYDHLSELLRSRRVDPADAAFTELDRWLRDGGAPPTPWQH
ncbi:hypothetical protein FHX37_0805 [Haloactinospora alba]|uniref:Uncharacterized protein n=1 Tax=Haloactinospora alba TaxID=405555 RepID=A0A543NGD7_9ACTN|nr:hypothetical protein [Haloactinospora alba]TQN30917.1 hypothetical protein FHX37_0805 [Haloactinospora alba]